MARTRERVLNPWILAYAAGGFWLTYLGTTTLGVLSPTIQDEFGLGHDEALWIVNAFMLTLALFTAPAGKIGDYYGHRLVMQLGFVVLAVGSLFSAIAQDAIWLFLSLGVQGIGAAALYPSSVAIVINDARPENSGKATGQWALAGAIVFSFGPVMAGLFTEFASWRWVFVFNIVACAVMIVVGFRHIKPMQLTAKRWDTLGTATLIIGLGLVLVAILEALAWGIAAPATLTLFFVGLGVLGLFLWIELKSDSPLLDLEILRDRMFAGTAIVLFATQFVVSGYLIYIATFLQDVIGFSALLAGVAMLAAYVFVPWNAVISGRITDRFGPRPSVIAGMIFLVAGAALAAIFAGADSYWLLLPSLVAMGLAQPYAITAAVAASAASLPPEERGEGEGLVTALRWIAAALATTVLGVVIARVRVGDMGHMSDLDAAISGYTMAFWVATGAAVLGLIVSLFAIRTRASTDDPNVATLK